MSSNSSSNPRKKDEESSNAGVVLGAVVGGVAVAVGGLYLLSKLFDDPKKEEPKSSALSEVSEEDRFSKAVRDNRSRQLNPNHLISGPGRPGGYPGDGSKPDLNNHANTLNPNNSRFGGGLKKCNINSKPESHSYQDSDSDSDSGYSYNNYNYNICYNKDYKKF